MKNLAIFDLDTVIGRLTTRCWSFRLPMSTS